MAMPWDNPNFWSAGAASSVTGIWNNANNFTWPGKDPELTSAFSTIMVTPTYGKTVGWAIAQGRDLSETGTAAVEKETGEEPMPATEH